MDKIELLKSNVRVVLCRPSHTGNIGATARAMKNMGLRELVLVSPKSLPDGQARAMASGALDVLDNLKIVDSLEEAVADCGWVLGTRNRQSRLQWPLQDVRTAADEALLKAVQTPVAVVFGPERTGLTNIDLELCHCHVKIPADPEYGALNLAQAVQVVCYELWMSAQGEQKLPALEPEFAPANMNEMQQFYQHLQSFLEETKFLLPSRPRQLMPRLRRLFNRAQLDKMELNILRGIFSNTTKMSDSD